MNKKAKQKSIELGPPEDIDSYGKCFVRLGEAMQDENTKMGDLYDLSLSCGLALRISLTPKSSTPTQKG